MLESSVYSIWIKRNKKYVIYVRLIAFAIEETSVLCSLYLTSDAGVCFQLELVYPITIAAIHKQYYTI